MCTATQTSHHHHNHSDAAGVCSGASRVACCGHIAPTPCTAGGNQPGFYSCSCTCRDHRGIMGAGYRRRPSVGGLHSAALQKVMYVIEIYAT